MRYGLMLAVLVLAGCAGSQFYAEAPKPGSSRVMICPAPELGLCNWTDMKQVGPSSQGSFTEPRH